MQKRLMKTGKKSFTALPGKGDSELELENPAKLAVTPDGAYGFVSQIFPQLMGLLIKSAHTKNRKPT